MHFFAEALTDDVIISTTGDSVVITVHSEDGSTMTRGILLRVVDGVLMVARDERFDGDDLLSRLAQSFAP